METWTKELMIGIVGSVIGAVVIYLFSFGFRWTKKSQEIRLKIRKQELADWKSGSAIKRQRISNSYLFSVLKFFVMGSILIGVSNTVADSITNNMTNLQSQNYVQVILDTMGVIFYLATFAKIIQFTKLLQMHP
jgi:hypothetical protein